ncbi:MAG: hypothetical protein HKN08_12235 [Gammaproteobacteria bacterium]|nr:hypothetical protein [Gammaproteobacteria bacterium]
MIEIHVTSEMVHRAITVFTKFTMLIGTFLAIYQGQFLLAAEILIIMFITFLPITLGKRFDIRIPHEFELLAIVFLYASLFLGEVHNYYDVYWWWDVVLHAGSGLLLGIIGFLLVYVLNEKDDINLELTAGFMGLFAFVFAVALGALWEIFEFTMDTLFGMNMQKTMFNDTSGLTDTMLDLIVDAVGAAIISILGYGYFRTLETDSFLEQWIKKFIHENPRLFQRSKNNS